MRLRHPVVLRLTLAAVVLIVCSCAARVPRALAPGADRVKFTQNAADVAGCKVVGNVSTVPSFDREDQLRNRAVGLDGNTVFLTSAVEGVAYRCP
jgi:hypothetical protein